MGAVSRHERIGDILSPSPCSVGKHVAAMHLMECHRLSGQMVAILRQEVDSMIRVIYLLSITDLSERQRLIEASVSGNPWTIKGKKAQITDREMAELSGRLHGWVASVYKFGCAFIHLSSFHDYNERISLYESTACRASRNHSAPSSLPLRAAATASFIRRLDSLFPHGFA